MENSWFAIWNDLLKSRQFVLVNRTVLVVYRGLPAVEMVDTHAERSELTRAIPNDQWPRLESNSGSFFLPFFFSSTVCVWVCVYIQIKEYYTYYLCHKECNGQGNG